MKIIPRNTLYAQGYSKPLFFSMSNPELMSILAEAHSIDIVFAQNTDYDNKLDSFINDIYSEKTRNNLKDLYLKNVPKGFYNCTIHPDWATSKDNKAAEAKKIVSLFEE